MATLKYENPFSGLEGNQTLVYAVKQWCHDSETEKLAFDFT